MKLKFWMIVVLLFSSTTFYAQDQIRIYGKVTDESGLPIELVAVAIDNVMRGTTTDSNGSYELPYYKSDSVSLHFSRLGYEFVVRRVSAQQDLRLDVVMASLSQQIGEISVEEKRITSVRMNKIDAKQGTVVPSASGNGVEDLIATLPGVSSTNELSSQYAVRGGNYDENLVYVNGIEIYRPLLIRSGQQEGLSFINPALVSNISFSSGGFDAEYGDKMSSVLDITYRQPVGFAASASVGLLGASAHVESRSKNGKFTQLHGWRYKTSAYLLNTLDTKAEYTPSFMDYQTLLRYKFNDSWSMSFLGNYSFNQYNFVPKSRETEFGTYNNAKVFNVSFDGWETDRFVTATGALSLRYSPSSVAEYQLTASSFQTNENESFDILGEYWLNEVETDMGAENYGDSIQQIGVGGYMQHARNDLQVAVNTLSFRASHDLGLHLVSWGLSLQHERISDQINEWMMRDSVGYSQPHSTSGDLEMLKYYNSDVNMNSIRTSGFVQDAYSADKISFTVGLRYNYWSFNKELSVSPRAAIVYAPENDRYWRFSLGRYVQAPFYKEIRDLSGDINDQIKSQNSFHFVLGYDYFFRLWERPFKYTFEAYYKHMTRLIPYDVDNVRIRYYGENMAKGYAYGVESRIFGEFVPGVDSWLGLSLLSTRERLDGTSSYERRPTDQRYNFTMFFQDYMPGNPNYKTYLKMIFGGGLPFSAPGLEQRKMVLQSRPYQRVDWGLSRLIASNKMSTSVVKSLWVDFEVLNLFGIKNANSYFWISDVSGNQYPVPNYLTGRRFNLKIMARF